jgi:AcrR family transcriptional regulator
MPRPTQPKRRNAPETKARILAAAQRAFSEHGYSQAGIRDIAALADVSGALVLRYYPSKAILFEAALGDAMPIESVLAVGVARENIGEHLAQQFMDPELEILPPSMIALATGDPDARDIASRVMKQRILEPLAKWLGTPDAEVRALDMLMHSISFVLLTRQFSLMPTKKGVAKKLAQRFAQTIQAIVDLK